MVYPAYRATGASGGPAGHSYAAVLIRADDAPVLAELRQLGFTGWLAPAAGGWTVAVAVPGRGALAAGRRGVAEVGAELAERLGVPVLAVRVLTDRQLAVLAWAGGEEAGRYVSDPSREPGADDDVRSDPVGVDDAAAIAAAVGDPPAGSDLRELLAERLDPETEIESERLGRLLRLFGLPTWPVAAEALPRDIPTGPRAKELTRLGAGATGPLGLVRGRLAETVRRRRPPAPVLADPPRDAGSDLDPWLM